jgi:hypothetical protein
MSVSQVASTHYKPDIRLSPAQIRAIAGAVAARGKGCNFLVFGCGLDSTLWAALNPDGFTLFMENLPEWAERVRAQVPGINVSVYSPATTVASALRSIKLSEEAIPAELTARTWDVILVDGPKGMIREAPGRSVSISWAARLRQPHTDVFVDDYERKLERSYADKFIAPPGTPRAVIERGRRGSSLLWSIGVGDEFYIGRDRPRAQRTPPQLERLKNYLRRMKQAR